jgi:coenzyme F420-dependent glucose-6-phosphate dehydrogenase
MNEVPLGVRWPDQKERFARLREACELIRRLWTEERVSYDGTHYHTELATIYDRPDPPVGLQIAASGPAAARLAGRLGDGFICTSGKAPELYRDTLIPAVREGLAKAGRDPSEIELTIEMKVSYDTDAQRCLEDTRFWGALALTPEEKTGVEDPVEMERLADALPVERTASRWIVSNEPEAQIEGIRPYIELGFTHLVFHAPGPDQARFLRLYSEQVLPRLRALDGGG